MPVNRLGILDWAIGCLMLALVIVVFAQVALRYLTYQPLAWTEEAGRFIFIWLSLLGAAAGGSRGAHFALDLLPRSLPPRAGGTLRVAICVAEAIFYGILTWAGVLIVQVTHLQRSASIDIPMSIPYAAVPIATALLSAYSMRQALAQLRGKSR